MAPGQRDPPLSLGSSSLASSLHPVPLWDHRRLPQYHTTPIFVTRNSQGTGNCVASEVSTAIAVRWRAPNATIQPFPPFVRGPSEPARYCFKSPIAPGYNLTRADIRVYALGIQLFPPGTKTPAPSEHAAWQHRGLFLQVSWTPVVRNPSTACSGGVQFLLKCNNGSKPVFAAPFHPARSTASRTRLVRPYGPPLRSPGLRFDGSSRIPSKSPARYATANSGSCARNRVPASTLPRRKHV